MDIKLKYRAYVGEKHPDIASTLIDSDIERFAIEFSEHLLEKLSQYNVVGRSEQLVCVGCGRTEQQHTGNGKDICPNYGGRFKATNCLQRATACRSAGFNN